MMITAALLSVMSLVYLSVVTAKWSGDMPLPMRVIVNAAIGLDIAVVIVATWTAIL